MSEESFIEAYPVGFFQDLRRLRVNNHVVGRGRAFKNFWYWFKRSYKRRSYWNGYLAEWHYPPEGMRHTQCGKGWTKKAAIRRLGKHIMEMNTKETH